MCLTTIVEECAWEKDEVWREGWKLFGQSYDTWYYMYQPHKESIIVERRTELTAHAHKVAIDRDTVYTSGFHLFETQAHAFEYHETGCYWDYHIAPILYRQVMYRGTQHWPRKPTRETPTLVARQIFVP